MVPSRIILVSLFGIGLLMACPAVGRASAGEGMRMPDGSARMQDMPRVCCLAPIPTDAASDVPARIATPDVQAFSFSAAIPSPVTVPALIRNGPDRPRLTTEKFECRSRMKRE